MTIKQTQPNLVDRWLKVVVGCTEVLVDSGSTVILLFCIKNFLFGKCNSPLSLSVSLSLCLSISLSLSLYLSFVNCMKEEYHIFFKNVTLLKTLKTIKFLIIFPTLNKSRIAFYQCSRFALMTDVMNLEKDIVDSNGRRISLHKIKSWKV